LEEYRQLKLPIDKPVTKEDEQLLKDMAIEGVSEEVLSLTQTVTTLD
jgi:hypothetical protein